MKSGCVSAKITTYWRFSCQRLLEPPAGYDLCGQASQDTVKFHKIPFTALVGIQYYGMNCRQKKKQHVLNFFSSACSSYHTIISRQVALLICSSDRPRKDRQEVTVELRAVNQSAGLPALTENNVHNRLFYQYEK